MNHFSFEYPWVLGLLLIFILCRVFCEAKSRTLFFPHLKLFMLGSPKKSYLALFLQWMGILLALVALASPVVTKEYSSFNKIEEDMVLLLDSSLSMGKKHFDRVHPELSRFDVIKRLTAQAILKGRSDRVGLVTFSDSAFVASPLSFEKGIVSLILQQQKLEKNREGRAIYDATLQGYALLEGSDAKLKVLLLLVGGLDKGSMLSLDEVQSIISQSRVKLYIVGVGLSKNTLRTLKQLLHSKGSSIVSVKNSEELKAFYSKRDIFRVHHSSNRGLIKKEYLFVYPLLFSILFILFFIYYRTVHHLKGSI
jgi:Ca-activated chloride channel family protein